MSDTNHIREIMLRYLNGESSEEESTVLKQWIAESKSNAEEFDLVKNIWNDSTEAGLLQVDTDKAWQSVKAQITGKEAKVVTLFSLKKILAVAAAILIVAGVYFVFFRPSKIIWQETLAQNDNKRIQLSDGTVIILRKGSKLSLPENYGNSSRRVKLEGEAYFEVKHNEKIPFSVATANSFVEDIGTAFLLRSTHSIEQVTVMEGAVSFSGKKENKKLLIIKAGESAVLINEIPQPKIVDTANLLSWNSKTLIFNNTSLQRVARDLENYYQVNVEIAGNLESIEITAEFRNESLEQVLKELRLFTGLKFQLDDGRILISK